MQEFNSKLSDFGLAKAGPTGDRTHVSTQVVGTQGYAAPEYVATGILLLYLYHCYQYLVLSWGLFGVNRRGRASRADAENSKFVTVK